MAASTGGCEGASDAEPVVAALGLAVTAEVPAEARGEAAELVAIALGAAAAVVAPGAAVALVAVLAEVDSVIGVRAF